MCTHSVIGALPLGLIVASDEKTETLVKAFGMYKDSLPEESFFKNGKEKGPTVFMTDNCSELKDALKIVWPSSRLVLCVFHILQQVWRWLHDKKHSVKKCDRQNLLNIFK